MDRYLKKLDAILSVMAREEPNRFIRELYYSGMDTDEIRELKHLVDIARRAKGYDAKQDLLKRRKII